MYVGRAICADDFKAKSCAPRLFHATDTCQTLAYVIHGAHSLLRRFISLSLFRGNDIKAFKTAAIEDDAGTKTASDGALSDRILRKWLTRRWTGHLCRV